MAEPAAETGVLVLDAPVSGGRPGADAPQLTTIVAGPSQALATVQPVLEAFSKKVSHMGAAGSGADRKTHQQRPADDEPEERPGHPRLGKQSSPRP
ncbi:NAD(P)-binding domain-containing protein [Arthrobacter humicola]